MRDINWNDIIKRLLWIALGQFIGATAFSQILLANNLIGSGLGGLAAIINKVTGFNVQITMVALATPLFIWVYFNYDRRQILYAIFSFCTFTLYIGIASKYIPPFITDPIIATCAGGFVLGISGGIVMRQRVANGPEAMIGFYIKDKKGISIGTYFTVLNTIIISSAIIYGNLTTIVYSLICNAIANAVTDRVIMGIERYYIVSVMSDEYLEITEYIQKKMGRSVTFVQGMDTADVKKKMLLQTIVNQQELVAIKDYIRGLSDDSFVYASRCTSIAGKGLDLD